MGLSRLAPQARKLSQPEQAGGQQWKLAAERISDSGSSGRGLANAWNVGASCVDLTSNIRYLAKRTNEINCK
jgi:hypothetical protein